MRYKPKGSWESVRVISGGDTSHHTSPTVMWMWPPNRELETTDTENVSVFGPRFQRVFNNHIPIYWSMLENIKQRDVMDKLDQTILWYEINKSTTNLINDKSQGLNGVPPNTFKELDNGNLSWLLLLYNQFWHRKSDFNK